MLYPIRGISASLFVAMLLAATVLVIATPTPPTAGASDSRLPDAQHVTSKLRRLARGVIDVIWSEEFVGGSVVALAEDLLV
jgi:hypothetical protein